MKKEYDLILAVYLITEENKDELERIYKKDAIQSDNSRKLEFVVGNVVVLRTIRADDLFSPAFGTRLDTVYIATFEEFDARFKIIDSPHNSEYFNLIDYK